MTEPSELRGDVIHTATLTVSSDYLASRWKFTCHAKVGAPCRMACGILHCEGNCKHDALVDQGECMEILWLENDDALDECQAGGDFVAWEGPVSIAWNNKNASEYYEFTPLAPGVPEPPNDAESECACQDMSQAFIGNHLPDCEFNPFISSAPTGLTVKEKIDALIDGAQSLFAEAFECKHSYSEPCGSCMNTGISAMDKDEFDFAVAVHDLAAIGRRYRNYVILQI